MKEDLLIKYITRAVQKEVEGEFDIRMKVLCDDINRKKNELVAGIVLSVMKTVEFNTISDTLTIRVREITKE